MGRRDERDPALASFFAHPLSLALTHSGHGGANCRDAQLSRQW
jgi:hypothetical protein